MSDPRKFNYSNADVNAENSRFFTEFPRIQVKPQRNFQDSDFRTLPTTERQELLSKLIEHVKEL